ncbi:hypothetical protein [Clostridium sp.]|uniref:hypothetical protein n=1 Tax=Clostridium sp. TaxID=1506 RepID=UPI003D6CD249
MNSNTEPIIKNNNFKEKIKSVFLKEYSLFTKLAIYTITLLLFIISVTIFTKKYVEYQKINLEQIQQVNLQRFIDSDSMIIKDGEIKMLFTPLKFNQFLKSEIQNLKIASLKENKILEYQYDNNSQRLYLNVQDKKKNIYSFSCKANMSVKNTQLLFDLSDYRLGKYKSRILGSYYRFSLGLPKQLSLFSTDKNNIILMKGIKQASPTEIEISYEYNYDKLIKQFNEYKGQLDEVKVKLCKDGEKVSPEIINVFTTGEITKDKVEKCIKVLEQNSNALEQCTLLLDEQGIRKICGDLKAFYAKNVNEDRLVEKSENAVDKNLSMYHYDFSKMLLNYLYVHRNYTVEGEVIYIEGVPLSADKILNENNYSKVYDIDIVNNSNGINATYKIGNKTVLKTVLRKE